ncbi:MAG: FHA domain-containing protein [Desulfatiglandales bacterium]|jgi:pSer/pThr/pTyr-binding forkhead associated (FHA) protein
MAKLLLTFNKQVINEHSFEKDSITIGRDGGNAIVIDNLAVSGFHARIDKVGSSYVLTDLQSTNGTFVNEEKVVSHRLAHGDNIIIGKHVILFLASDSDEVELETLTTGLPLDKTVVLDTAKQRALLSKQKLTLQVPKVPERIGVLSFIDGSGLGDLDLTRKLTRLGKANTSEIKLSGLLMAPTAATISRRPSGYVISFAGGMSKLKVNGRVIKGSVQLNDFDTVELGSYKFQFYLKDAEI